jgi:sec-independent protein translocase protein TatA
MSLAILATWTIPVWLAWFPSTGEWIVIAAFGLILFGKKLPEVGRSLGKGIVEFKKGLKGIEDDVDRSSEQRALPRKEEPSAKPRETVDSAAGGGDTDKNG